MNLFPYYSTPAQGVNTFIKDKSIYNQALEKNIETLKEVTQNVNDIIVAWGKDSIGCKDEYTKVISQVENEIKDKDVYYVGTINEDGTPLHAQVWADSMIMQRYN